MTQAQLSRIEHGPPIKDLDRLTLWARTLRIPTDLLWFKLPDESPGHVRSPGKGDGLTAADKVIATGLAAADADGEAVSGQEPPRTLPPAIPDFTGREQERARLAAALRRPDLPRWVLICGQAGLGKTALAIRVAHDVAAQFPDGQLFVRLRRPDGAAVPPEIALAALLGALGYRGPTIPQQLDERSGLFRSAVSDRKLLVVLDDVVDDTQLRWLLPGSPACAVLITSRSRLTGIEGLDRPAVERLSVAESQAVLRRIVGDERVDAEPDAANDLIELAAGLPLALRIIAARLASRPRWHLDHMRQLLADKHRRLDWLKAGDQEVRASFIASYAHLTTAQQRLFRLLGLLDAPDFPAWIASALTGDPTGRTEQDLDDLADVHLVDVTPDHDTGPRYRLHPLVRLLATELAVDQDPPNERDRAIRRVITGYLTAADTAAKALPPRFVFDNPPDDCWMPPSMVLALAESNPQYWFAVEQAALRATISQAAATHTGLSWRLLQRFALHLDHRHDLDTIERLAEAVLERAKETGDRRGEAELVGLLSHALAYRSRIREIPPLVQRAVRLRHTLGDVHAEVEARKDLGLSLALLGRSIEARKELRIALKLSRRLGLLYFTGRILIAFAHIQTTRNENRVAIQTYRQALKAFKAAGCGTATAARDFGILLMIEGQLNEAESVMLEAHGALIAEGDHWRAATVQVTLADVYIKLRQLEKAEEMLLAGHAVLRAHHDTYGDGVALYISGRLAEARGDNLHADLYAKEAAAAWARLPWKERSGLEQWRGPRESS